MPEVTDWISGNVTYYTSNTAGLLIMVDDGVPDNCAGTPYGWMIISADDKTMLAVALMRISQDKIGVSLYSTGAFYSGYCRVGQYEPAD